MGRPDGGLRRGNEDGFSLTCQRRSARWEPVRQGAIVASLQRHPYTAQQILQQLRTQGYAGGCFILEESVRQVRPVRPPSFLRLGFGPGECAQGD